MEDNNMSFIQHFGVLRKYFFRALIFLVIGFIISFSNKDFIFNGIILPLKNIDFITYKLVCEISKKFNSDNLCIKEIPIIIQNRKLTGQFFSHIMVSIISGIIISFPFIIYQFWSFIKPALDKSFKKKIIFIYFWINMLFLIGIFFGYFIISPVSINFLSNYSISSEVSNEIDLGSFIGIISSIILASGIIFLLPIFIYFLTKMGLIDYMFLKKYRRHSLVLIVIFSAVITPPDISSQIFISLPLLLLYEIGIIISKKIKK